MFLKNLNVIMPHVLHHLGVFLLLQKFEKGNKNTMATIGC